MARGVNTLVDELDFYMETRDIAGSVLTIVSTATQTVNGVTVQQTGAGAIFYINPNPILATCTARYNLIANDPVSGRVFVLASLSLDGLAVTTTGNGFQILYVTPQAATGINGTGATVTTFVQPLPRNLRVQASITVASSATGAYSGTVGMTRLGVI